MASRSSPWPTPIARWTARDSPASEAATRITASPARRKPRRNAAETSARWRGIARSRARICRRRIRRSVSSLTRIAASPPNRSRPRGERDGSRPLSCKRRGRGEHETRGEIELISGWRGPWPPACGRPGEVTARWNRKRPVEMVALVVPPCCRLTAARSAAPRAFSIPNYAGASAILYCPACSASKECRVEHGSLPTQPTSTATSRRTSRSIDRPPWTTRKLIAATAADCPRR
jgi:hypothetical protein